jgi:hypothetical protein
MAIMNLKRLSLLGLALVFSSCWIATAEPPQPGNLLLQVKRDQLADALGESHPTVLASDVRIWLENASRERPVSTERTPIAPETQLKHVIDAFNEISGENARLKQRIRELESQLRECHRLEAEAK